MLVGCWSAYWCHLLFLVQLLHYSIFTWHNLHTCFLFYLLFFAFVISHFLVLCFRFCFLASCNDTHYNHWLGGLIAQVKLHKGKFQNQKHKKVKAHFRLKLVFLFCVVLVSIIKTPLIKCNLKVDDWWFVWLVCVVWICVVGSYFFFVFHFLVLLLLLCFDIFELNKSTNKNRTINQWICKSDTSATRFEQVWTNTKHKTHFSLHFFCWWLLCFVFHSHFYFQNQDQNALTSNDETHGEGGAAW